MLGIENLLLFIFSGLLLNITPGADMLYVLGRSASQGARGGSIAALGIGGGCLVHVSFATAGISAILTASAAAFGIVKMIGAAYLVYLGIRFIFKKKGPTEEVAEMPRTSGGTIFWQGFLTNALNPKVALFFLAFLPQFISPDSEYRSLGLLFLGILFTVNGTIVNVLVALGAAGIASRFRESRLLGRILNSTVGALFVYFGIRLALSRH